MPLSEAFLSWLISVTCHQIMLSEEQNQQYYNVLTCVFLVVWRGVEVWLFLKALAMTGVTVYYYIFDTV